MTYCCENCDFLFRRVGVVDACPFCEGSRFRPATEEEAERLQLLLMKEKSTAQTIQEDHSR